jgi:hypothetical protein
LTPPLGPALSCSDFVRDEYGFWRVTRTVQINTPEGQGTLWPTTRMSRDFVTGGLNVGSLVNAACGER